MFTKLNFVALKLTAALR